MAKIDNRIIQKDLPENSTKLQLKHIIFKGEQGNVPLKIVTGNYLYYSGLPGNGKTT